MQIELEQLISEINAHALSDEQFKQLHQYQQKLDKLEAFIIEHENDGIRNCMVKATKAFMSFHRKMVNKPTEDFNYLKGQIAYTSWKNEGLKRNKTKLNDTLNKLEKLHEKNLEVRAYAMLSMAAAEYQHGDYEASLVNLNTIKNLLSSFNYDNINYFQIIAHANMHNSYGLAYRATNKYDKALIHFKKSLSILELYTKDTDLDGPKLALMNNIASIFTQQKKWKEALLQSKKFIFFVEQQLKKAKTLNYVRVQLSSFLITISLCYTFLNKFKEANEKLLKAEKLIGGVEPSYHFMYANLLYNKSIYSRRSGDYKAAIEQAQQSFQYIFSDFDSLNIEDNPNIKQTDFDKMQKLIIQSFSAKAGALLACYIHENKDLELLKICLKAIDNIAVYFDAMRANYKGEVTKFSLGYYSKNLYNIGQLACWHLYKTTAKIEYAEKAFAYANNSKALVLLEEMNKKWFDKSEEHISYKQIQTQLKSNEMLLEYSIGEKGIFVYQLSKIKALHFDYISIEDAQQMEEQVKHFLKQHFNIYRPDQYETYQEEAMVISELILPYLKKVKKDTTLLIAPDGFLNTLPFEALVKRKKEIESYQEIDYLIDDYTFAYTFSSYLLYLNRKKSYIKPKRQFLYISPNFLGGKSLEAHQLLKKEQEAQLQKVHITDMNYASTPFIQFENDQLDLSLLDDDQQIIISKAKLLKLINSNKKQTPQALIYNAALVKNLSKIIAQQFTNKLILEDKKAHTQALQENIKEANCVLISSHADTEKGIILYNEKGDDFTFLSYEAIIKQNLQAQLVVLNMCDSGIGRSVFGEGYLSLGRAFFAAGSLNVVKTLYKVSDKYSAHLIDAFFTNLVQHKLSFYEALRRAKLLLRKENNSHPKFWAGHVIYGKNGVL